MERSGEIPLAVGMLAACFIFALLVPASASSLQGLTVKVVASPTQVQENQNTTLTAIIKNVGATSVGAVNVTVVTPQGWNQWLHEPQATGSTASVMGKVGSGNYSLGTLAANQTFILQVDVRVIPGTQAGNYTIFLITNPTSPGVDEVSAIVGVKVAGPAALPLGGATIPVSLILILLPGFVTLMLVVWVIGRSLDASWQVGLAVTLVSFFLGFFEWFVAGYLVYIRQILFLGIWPANDLVGTILNLDILTISGWQVLAVTILAVVCGILGGVAVQGLNLGKQHLEDWFEERTSGYIHNNEKVWKNLLNSAFESAIRQHGGGWAPLISVTTTDDVSYREEAPQSKSGEPTAHSGPPHVTLVETTTKTDSRDVKDQKGLPAKEPPLATTTVEEKHETTETKSHSTDSSPPTPPKVSHLAGLLYSFDDTDPQDIVMGPQYEVEVSVSSELFVSISRMMKWGSKSLEGARGGKERYEEWEKAAREYRYPRNFPKRMTKLLRHLGEFESVQAVTVPKESEHPGEGQIPGGTHLPAEEGKVTTRLIGYGGEEAPPLTPGKDEPKRLIGSMKWIKHPEVLAVDVFGPRPLYVFHLAKGKDATAQDSQAGKTH